MRRLRSKVKRVVIRLAQMTSRWHPAALRAPVSQARMLLQGSTQEPAQPLIDSFMYGSIDSPLEEASVTTSVLSIIGWAVSKSGNVERALAYLDDELLGPLTCGLPRDDVMTALQLTESDHGFAGRFDLPRTHSGRHEVRIAVTDDDSHESTLVRAIQLSESAVAESALTLHLDSPTHNMPTVDLLPVKGWAFSAISPVVSIETEIDGEPAGSLCYGAQREDVYTAFRIPLSRMSGLEGTLDVRRLRPGVHRLTVRARTYNGATAHTTRRFLVQSHAAAHLDIDRCEWRGDTLTVEGWAILPGEHRPWRVTVFADEQPVATGRVGLSRLDVGERFPQVVSAVRSGFTVSGLLPAPQSVPTAVDAQVRVQVEDTQGHRVDHTLSVHHIPDEPAQVVAAVRSDLEDLVWQARLRTHREPSILNLARSYPIAEALSYCNVFGMPDGVGDPRAARVAQGSADIVVTDEVTDEPWVGSTAQHVEHLEQAPAVALAETEISARDADTANAVDVDRCDPVDKPHDAGHAQNTFAHVLTAELHWPVPSSLRASPSGWAGSQRTQVVAHWNPDATLSPIPSVSVVIPVYNKIAYTRACVERVLATVQPAIPLEVIVVDDCSSDETPEVLASLARSDERVRIERNETNLGFLRSSNRGAEIATGEILVFLNNDTLPEPHWLEPLLFTLLTQPDAGAVGGKLLYPDGVLQEAGGVIFSDAGGANYGRGDVAPDHPLYHSLREVDYCSGALLATPRDFFVALGAFDERYSPAYYEDTDYCFRVREHGRRVYYQPESVIVHFEGVSSGRDLNQGVKRYQVVNRQKFAERWAAALQHQGPPPLHYDRAARHDWAVRFEREHSEQNGQRTPRRALLVFATIPEFNHEGGSRQHSALIEFLCASGWQVTVVAHHIGKENWYTRSLRQRGVQVYFGPLCALTGDGYLESLDDLLQDAQFQLAILSPWYIAEAWIPTLRARSPEAHIIVDSMDAHFLRAIRQALVQPPVSGVFTTQLSGADGSSAKTVNGVVSSSNGRRSATRHTTDQLPALFARPLIDQRIGDEMVRELNSYASADLVLAVSAKEATFLGDFLGATTPVEALQLVEPTPLSTVPVYERRGMVFIGNFRHPPNVEAVEYLCEEIVPLLSPETLHAHPIIIMGTDMPAALWDLTSHTPGVVTLGWVPSVTPYLHQARISLVPLLHGAGTKVKLIQAAMAGTPSVSTSIGVEGLLLEDEQHVLIADDPQGFADAITRLVGDDHLWARLAVAGYEHIHARHNPAIVRDRFSALVERVLRAVAHSSTPAEQAELLHNPIAFNDTALPTVTHADSASSDDSSDGSNGSNGKADRSSGPYALLAPIHQRADES